MADFFFSATITERMIKPCVYLSEVESRTQGSRPRPRTQKKSEAKAKDSLSEDRTSRGQGQECSRPRPRTKDTSASALQKKKKRSSQKFFRRSPQKNVFQKIFQPLHRIYSAVLEPRTGQFSRTWGLEAKAKDLTFEAEAKDFKICPRGLHLWYLCFFSCLADFTGTINKFKWEWIKQDNHIIFGPKLQILVH